MPLDIFSDLIIPIELDEPYVVTLYGHTDSPVQAEDDL